MQEAKGNPHCRQLSLRPKKTLVLRRGTTLSFSTSAGGIRGEDPEQNSPEKSSINQLPAKTFFSKILQSPLKCFLVLGKPRERACFKRSESSPVSLSLPWLLVKQPFEARFMWHQHLCRAESGRRQPLLFFFSAGKKMGHRRTEVALWSFTFGPSSLLVILRGFGKSENPTSRGVFQFLSSTYTISNHSLLRLHLNKKDLDRWVP